MVKKDSYAPCGMTRKHNSATGSTFSLQITCWHDLSRPLSKNLSFCRLSPHYMTGQTVVISIFRLTDRTSKRSSFSRGLCFRGLRFLGVFRFRGLRFLGGLRFRGVFSLRSSFSRHPKQTNWNFKTVNCARDSKRASYSN